jgi:hypothetical protein
MPAITRSTTHRRKRRNVRVLCHATEAVYSLHDNGTRHIRVPEIDSCNSLSRRMGLNSLESIIVIRVDRGMTVLCGK